jgi:hypothetical protein
MVEMPQTGAVYGRAVNQSSMNDINVPRGCIHTPSDVSTISESKSLPCHFADASLHLKVDRASAESNNIGEIRAAEGHVKIPCTVTHETSSR